MKTILLISPYWKEDHRWMVSSYKMAELWQRIGYRVVVACMGSETKRTEVSPTLTVCTRKDVFLKDPWNYGICLGFSGFVRGLVREVQPDVIVVNKVLFWTSMALIPLRLTGRKVILLTDALVGMTWWPRGRIARVCAALYAWTLGWLILCCASKIVFFHPQPRGLLRLLCIAGKSDVIPTGIDLSGYGPPVRDSAHPVVTYVGRLESVKGVDDFLAAMAPLKRELPHIAIRVAGWYAPGHPLVERYGKDVEFLGLRNDVPAVLAHADVFVMPSYSEGLSNALMEAMASSCACVATAVGGNRYLLADDAGMLFVPGDRDALGELVRRLLTDDALRADYGKRARMRIERTFSWDTVGKRYDALFSSFVA